MGGSTKAYTRTLVSFQSTGATNICGVNNLPSMTNYVSKKARGKGKTKRVWGIEQNEARETYLCHYYGIDNFDHMIKNTSNRYYVELLACTISSCKINGNHCTQVLKAS